MTVLVEVLPVCPRCATVNPWMTQDVRAWTRVETVNAYGTLIGRIEGEEFGAVTCDACGAQCTEAELVAASFAPPPPAPRVELPGQGDLFRDDLS